MATDNQKRRYSERDRELFDFARVYLSEAFPNPARVGCPSDQALKSHARRPQESTAWIAGHVTSCSPCFNVYIAYLEKKPTEATEPHAMRSLSSAAWLVSVGAIVVILLIGHVFIGKAHIWRHEISAKGSDYRVPVVQTQPPGPATYPLVMVDLSNSSPLRGNSWKKRPVQSIPSDAAATLELVLPLGSELRLYDVNLSSKRKVMWSGSAKAQVNDGQVSVAIIVDFRSLPAGNYDLTVMSEGFHVSVPVILTRAFRRSP